MEDGLLVLILIVLNLCWESKSHSLAMKHGYLKNGFVPVSLYRVLKKKNQIDKSMWRKYELRYNYMNVHFFYLLF